MDWLGRRFGRGFRVMGGLFDWVFFGYGYGCGYGFGFGV